MKLEPKYKAVGIPITPGMWDQPESITMADYSNGEEGEVACIFRVHFLWFPHSDVVVSVRSKWDDSIAPEENWVIYPLKAPGSFANDREQDALMKFIERNKTEWVGLVKELITKHIPA